MALSEKLLSYFPVPARIAMPAAGLDISDQSVKFIELERTHDGLRVGRFATKEIPKGIIVAGAIADHDALVRELSAFREEHDLAFVRASLPEEPGYIFTTQVPDVAPEEIRSLLRFKLEEHVPLAPTEAVVDYDIVEKSAVPGGAHIVAVSVFPEKLAQDYADLLHASGLRPVSLEIEAQALARSVVPKGDASTCMIVDIGRMRSGLSIAQGGAVRFTTTLSIGGEGLTAKIASVMGDADPAEILRVKNEEGLGHMRTPAIRDAMGSFAETLRKEIERYYLYWQTRKDGKDKEPDHIANPPVQRIILSGGYANIGGLPEYLTQTLRVKTVRADVWTNAFSIEEHIPPIGYRDSFGYAAAIGLALHADDLR